MNKLLYASTALALALIACGASAATVETPFPEPTATTALATEAGEQAGGPQQESVPTAVTGEPQPATPPAPVDVDVPGADGLTLKGTFYGAAPDAAPAVLLLHMYGRTRADWDELARILQGVGIASLAVDLRGHGQTGGSENWLLAPQDVSAALDWLAAKDDVDADRLGVLGASIGANLALVLGSGDSRVDAIGLLSPGFEYFRVDIGGLMTLYGDRPALLAASEGDGYSAQTVRSLADEASGPVVSLVYSGSAHGTDIFFTEPSLADVIVNFLGQYLVQ